MDEVNIADVIYDINLPFSGDCHIVDPLDPTHDRIIKRGTPSKDLLIPIFRKGLSVYESPSLQEIKRYAKKELEHFHIGIKRFINPHSYIVGMEKSLYKIKIDLIKSIRQSSLIVSQSN